MRTGRFLLSCMALLCTLVLNAQEGEVMLNLRTGHNAAFDNFTAISIEAGYSLEKHFSICGGVQYNTIGKTSAEVVPSYFHNLDWGVLSAELLLHCSNMHQTGNFATGAGLALKTKWIRCRAGYYFRTFGNRAYRINEPFNIYYSMGVNCLPDLQKWDLSVCMTNCEIFELERHYQPSFIVQGWYYPSEQVGITLGVNCKPAGMFHLSADYYQLYAKAGVCYRW